MLMFSQKVSGREGVKMGLVSEVVETGEESFQGRLRQMVHELLTPLSSQALESVKELIMGRWRQELHSVRVQERDLLRETLSSPQVLSYALKFLAKK